MTPEGDMKAMSDDFNMGLPKICFPLSDLIHKTYIPLLISLEPVLPENPIAWWWGVQMEPKVCGTMLYHQLMNKR